MPSDKVLKERARFVATYQDNLKEIGDIPLSILVWGPGTHPTSQLVRDKRVQIRERLEELEHNAMFSEDLEQYGNDRVLKLQELAQVVTAHHIVILLGDYTPGALAETHDFANLPRVAWKFTVLVPKKFQNGYSANGTLLFLDKLFHSVYWYEDDEIQSCNVLGRVLERMDYVRQFYASAGGALL